MTSLPSSLVASIADRVQGTEVPVVVGVAGPVAVGKTTFAALLQDELSPPPPAVRSTDGFLLPNHTLVARGLLERKGFPESYDVDGLIGFLEGIRTDPVITGLQRYSHDTFDVEPDPQPFLPGNLVIIEGVNALQASFVAHLDVGIYLDADEQDIIGWFTRRFHDLTDQARRTGSGFYTRFAQLSEAQLDDVARFVWDSINAPNLHRCILPTRDHADWVIHTRADHSLEVVRSPGTT